MSITRDPDVPADIAQLVAAFNICADGHSHFSVLEASANMLVAAVGAFARQQGGDKNAAVAMAAQVAAAICELVADQWDRQPQPTDVEVRHG